MPLPPPSPRHLRELAAADPLRDRTVRAAIRGRRLLAFVYRGVVRLVEPHDYGVRNGRLQVLVRQLLRGGRVCPPDDWRTLLLAGMDDLRPLPERFPGGTPTSSGAHVAWDLLILRVGPAPAPARPSARPPASRGSGRRR